MDEKLNFAVVRYGRSFTEWINDHNFKLVLILSLLYIGLAYIHTQHPSRADHQTSPFRFINFLLPTFESRTGAPPVILRWYEEQVTFISVQYLERRILGRDPRWC